MIRLQQIKLPVTHTPEELTASIAHMLHLQSAEFSYEILRKSLDARKKPSLFYIYTVDVTCRQEQKVLKRLKGKNNASLVQKNAYKFPALSRSPENDGPFRPVVIGTGPAGLFCALMLARSGLRPILVERGKRVDQRQRDVKTFWETGVLDPSSNVQFGEGGAGTFSDGKLNTAIKDPAGRIRFVLEQFVKAGADHSILYDYKPHVGTDILARVVAQMRGEIESLGGTYYFSHRLHKITRAANTVFPDRPLYHLQLEGDEVRELETDTLVLAIGHSARDTFTELFDEGFCMNPKAFAVGVRVQHPQEMINHALYGPDWKQLSMPPASYKLTHKLPDGRGVYSFCMCPGGYVVNASSEPGHLAVNGMSYHDRNSLNANSAIVVTVKPEDFPDSSPLGGIAYQRRLEKAAYEEGRGRIPLQTFADFKKGRPSEDIGHIQPEIKGGWRAANVRAILPENIAQAVQDGITSFERQISGFSDPDTLICGVESRTSSPVRIERDEALEAVGFPGIYPCGEGAGYAGGITSAAVDGLRTAEAVVRRKNGSDSILS